MKRSRRVAKQGWEQAEGTHPAGILEIGSMSSGKKAESNVEKREENPTP